MLNATVPNPKLLQVVTFHNKEAFGFTPDMGCMYDGFPINGNQGGPGINAGESMLLMRPVAEQLALNLAKVAMTRQAPAVDPAGIPTGVPLWDSEKLERIKNSYLTDMYSETRPVAMTETERLLAKVEELNKFVRDNIQPKAEVPATPEAVVPEVVTPEAVAPEAVPAPVPPIAEAKYQDKQEVILELEKRGIKHDKRSNKETLEKLLA